MFTKGTTDKTKTFKVQGYKPGKRIPVFPAISLLADKKHQFFLQQLREFCKLPQEHFELLYKKFVHSFVEFVQVLPTQNDSPLCGLMNDGLLRGINSLHQLTLNYKDASPLERYAVFTAAVLRDVANVVVNQKVFITDEEGATAKVWEPFEGSLESDQEAEFYKIIPLSSTYHRISHSVTPMLARQLLPKPGFAWISSDAQIFADWLDALLGDDAEGVGRVAHTIQLFKNKSPENLLMDSLPAVTVTMQESPATTYGDRFFEWLKNGIARGEIKVNTSDACVHVTQQGIFIERGAIFKQYVDLHVEVPVNMFSVYQQFGNLFGLTKLSGIDYRIEQLFSEYPDFSQGKSKIGFASPLSARANQIREGVMIADPSLIFMSGEVPSPTPHLKSLPASQRPQNIPQFLSPQSGPNSKNKM